MLCPPFFLSSNSALPTSQPLLIIRSRSRWHSAPFKRVCSRTFLFCISSSSVDLIIGRILYLLISDMTCSCKLHTKANLWYWLRKPSRVSSTQSCILGLRPGRNFYFLFFYQIIVYPWWKAVKLHLLHYKSPIHEMGLMFEDSIVPEISRWGMTRN